MEGNSNTPPNSNVNSGTKVKPLLINLNQPMNWEDHATFRGCRVLVKDNVVLRCVVCGKRGFGERNEVNHFKCLECVEVVVESPECCNQSGGEGGGSGRDKGKRKLSEYQPDADRPESHKELNDGSSVQEDPYDNGSALQLIAAEFTDPQDIASNRTETDPQTVESHRCPKTANEYCLENLREAIVKWGGVLADGWHVDMVLSENKEKTFPVYHGPDGKKFERIADVASHLGLQPCSNMREAQCADGGATTQQKESSSSSKRKHHSAIYIRRRNRQKWLENNSVVVSSAGLRITTNPNKLLLGITDSTIIENNPMDLSSSFMGLPFPSGETQRSHLPACLIGDILQAWDFSLHFPELLGLEESFSFHDLELELLNPWLDQLHPLVKPPSGTPEIGEINVNVPEERVISHSRIRPTGFILAQLQGSLLRLMAGELPCRASQYVDRNIGSGEYKLKSGRKKETDTPATLKKMLNMLPVNEFTWPEVARRYVLAALSLESNNNSSDGGVVCDALTRVTGLEEDALIFAEAMKKISSLIKSGDAVAVECEQADVLGSSISNEMKTENIPEWALALEPVLPLPTNVGSRLRKWINEALEKDPPEWAKIVLELSLTKEVYKHNAAGKTKKAVRTVLLMLGYEPVVEKLEKKGKQMSINTVNDLVTNLCQIALRRTIAADENRDLCNLLGRTHLNVSDSGVLSYPGMVFRPLDWQSIDLRLEAGAYDGYHEAFFDDVQEVFHNIRIAHSEQPDLMKVADQLWKTFEKEYNSKVLLVARKIVECGHLNSSKRAILEGVDHERKCLIPRAPWEEGICEVCGLYIDYDNVLLCDGSKCDSEYHISCLNPPLQKIPEGKWYCPTCVARRSKYESISFVFQQENQCEQNKCQGKYPENYMKRLAQLANAMEVKEFWELTEAERVLLLNFLCEEAVNSIAFREHIDRCMSLSAYLQEKQRHVISKLKIQKFGEEQLEVDLAKGNCLNNDPRHKTVGPHSTGLEVSKKMFSTTGNQTVVGETSKLVDSIENTNLLKGKGVRGATQKFDMDLDCEFPVTRALANLKKVVDSCSEQMTIEAEKYPLLRVKESGIYRCECLEALWPSRNHCFTCHQSFLISEEPMNHACKAWTPVPKSSYQDQELVNQGWFFKSNGDNFGSSTRPNLGKQRASKYISRKKENGILLIPKSVRTKYSTEGNRVLRSSMIYKLAERPLVGKVYQLLRCLKMVLLDIDAALEEEAFKTSRSSPNRRRAWRSITKDAGTIYEMVQATILLEDMIKSDNLKNDWWYWSSPSAAAKITTLSGLSLRIFTLDSTILYQKSVTVVDPATTPEGVEY